jgi:hypothetical protein
VEEDPSRSEHYRVHHDVPEHELKVQPPSPMPQEVEGYPDDGVHAVEGGQLPQ